MQGAVFLGLAVLVDAGAAGLSWSQARRAASPAGDLAALPPSLKRLPENERLAELLRRTPPGSWGHALASEAQDAVDEAARVAVVNEALAEAEHALTQGAGWPRASIRIALLGSALLAVAAFLADGGWSLWTLLILACGGSTVLACVEAGRSAHRSAVAQRRTIDDLIAAVFGDTGGPSVARRSGPIRPASPPWRGRRRP